jgi:hypothetical protein
MSPLAAAFQLSVVPLLVIKSKLGVKW